MAANNKFTVDSSFVLSFLLPDENEPIVEDIFDQFEQGKIELIGASLLPFEVFNGLETAVLRKRLSFRIAQALGQKFLNYNIILYDIDYQRVQNIANNTKLTFYDAAYLYLSRSQNIPLLTLDKKLKSLS